MHSHSYHKLLFISLFCLIIFNSAQILSAQGISAEPSLPPDTSPNLQPAASPGSQQEMSPTPSFAASAEYISIPPTIEPPSDSPSPTPSLSPYTPPNLQSAASPGPKPEISPTPNLAPAVEQHFSIPPTTEPPSDSPSSPTPSLAPYTSPNFQPAASPGPKPEISPTASSPSDSSLPISDPPSDSISPSISNLILDAESPFNADSPSGSLPPSSDIDPRVKKICDSTDYPSLCLSTIVPLLNGKTDIASMLEVEMNVSADFTRVGMSIAKKLANSPETPPDLVTIYNDCTDRYDSALYDFQNAMDAFVNHDIGTMNTMLSAVITDLGDCEDEFSGTVSPLSKYADQVTKMTSNCLAIVSLLQ